MLRAPSTCSTRARSWTLRDITIESYDTDEESGWAASCDGVVGQTDSRLTGWRDSVAGDEPAVTMLLNERGAEVALRTGGARGARDWASMR